MDFPGKRFKTKKKILFLFFFLIVYLIVQAPFCGCQTCVTRVFIFSFSAGFWLHTVLSFTSLVSSRHAACNERLTAVF